MLEKGLRDASSLTYLLCICEFMLAYVCCGSTGTDKSSSRIMDFLDGGIASSARIDGLGKGVGEYLRSKNVDVPIMFLQRGII